MRSVHCWSDGFGQMGVRFGTEAVLGMVVTAWLWDFLGTTQELRNSRDGLGFFYGVSRGAVLGAALSRRLAVLGII